MSESSIDGLVSGLKTSDLINQLMQIERQPQQRLQQARSDDQTVIDAYQSITQGFTGVSSAAQSLATSSAWQAAKASSSDTDTVTATAAAGAGSGSLRFTVDRLATAASLVSGGSAASLSTVVGSGNLLLSQAGGLGLASLGGDAALALGAHTVKVTQASAAAAKTADAALDASTTLGQGATIEVTVDGAAKTLSLAAGTYASPAALLAAVAGAASGAGLAASLDASGRLRLATVAEGSAHTLQVTGGGALAALHLSADAGAHAGADGVIDVDGTQATVSDARAGATTTLALAGGGQVTATLAGGLRAGSVSATNVSLGDGSLASVSSAINSAGAGVTATAVQVGSAAYRLQLASTSTGAASALTIDTSAFAAGLGTLNTLDAGSDAQLTVGSGANAYQVASASNTVTGVLPGVSLTLLQESSTAVTVTMSRDGATLADQVGKMVDAVNTTLSAIKSKASYDAGTKAAGPLLGDGAVRRLQQQLYDAISDPVGSSSLGSSALAGITIAQDGSVAFDRDKFLSAFASNPDAVANLFRQGGTTADARVAFNGATTTTRAGAFTAVVTQAATRTSVTGAQLAAVAADETLSLRVGGVSVSYTAHAGDTLESVAAGLNAAVAGSSLGLAATVESSRLVLRSGVYGSAGKFDVQSSGTGLGLVSGADAWQAHNDGLDVAGYFLRADGLTTVTATGAGQVLTAAPADPTLGGLSVKATASSGMPLSVSGSYTPGLAQRLDTLARDATNSVDGRLTVATQGRRTEMSDLDGQIAAWDTRLAQRELTLRNQFSQMEVALGQLKDQSNWLSSQVSNL